MIAFFETMMAEEGRAGKALSYLATHPSTEDRLARLRQLVPTGGPAPTPALTGEEWSALRAVCARP
jgi:predicted Zn-dependent protease